MFKKLILFFFLDFFFLKNVLSQELPKSFFVYPVAVDFSYLTCLSFLPDSSILVGEKDGRIKIVRNKTWEVEDIFAVKTNIEGERGLLSVAVHPDFNNFPYVYIFYTIADGSRNNLSRIRLNMDHKFTGNEEVLVEFDSLKGAIMHNGGGMKFGPDKNLYVGIGDHATYDSENFENFYGKLIRIAPDGSIPLDNPYSEGSTAKKLTWAIGLRNPFTIDIDRLTGSIYVNDVGSQYWEEINKISEPKLNLGWPGGEGARNSPLYTDPIFSYPNNLNKPLNPVIERGCAITGGTIFNPVSTSYPNAYNNSYFYADGCNLWINQLDLSTFESKNFATGLEAFGLTTGVDGNLYYVRTDKLWKIVYDNDPKIKITYVNDNIIASEGRQVRIKVYHTGKGPFTYKWQRDGVDLISDNNPELIIPGIKRNHTGSYRLIISNSVSVDTTKGINVEVIPNTPPQAHIELDFEKKTYAVGDTIWYRGKAIDNEDIEVPAENYTWTCNFHHETHLHPGPALNEKKKDGYFVIPDIGEKSTNVWFRIILVVRDSNNETDTAYTDVYPNIVNVKINTIPEGLSVKVNKKEHVAPVSFNYVAGNRLDIEFDTIQYFKNAPFHFMNWNFTDEKSNRADIYPYYNEDLKINFGAPPIFVDSEEFSSTVLEGTKVEILIPHFGTEPFNYVWEKDGKTLSNVEKNLVFQEVQLSDSGAYRLKITNSIGEITSKPYHLKVIPSSKLVFSSNINGCSFYVNDSMYYTPFTIQLPQGLKSMIQVPALQKINGKDYVLIDSTGIFRSGYSITIPNEDLNFNINLIAIDDLKTVSIYPNPFGDELKINFFTPAEVILTYKIIDMLGREKAGKALTAYKGYNFISVGNNLSEGTYFLRGSIGNRTFNLKIIKIR